jgi:hypothetical protein
MKVKINKESTIFFGISSLTLQSKHIKVTSFFLTFWLFRFQVPNQPRRQKIFVTICAQKSTNFQRLFYKL